MSSKAIYLAIGLVAGVAASAWYMRSPESPSSEETQSNVQSESVDARFSELETSVAEQLDSVRGEIESLQSDLAALSASSNGSNALPPQSPPDVDAENPSNRGASSLQRERDRLRELARIGPIKALTDAGFSPARAQEIERLIDEQRVAALQSRYEAARRGDSGAAGNVEADETFSTDEMLRSALGDEDFGRYLESMGRPTDITVVGVLSSSAAEQAGMLPRDQIVAYDGHRVFDVREITPLAVEGEPGAPVIVDIIRDGQAMQLVVPRGPLGIMAPVGPLETTEADQK